MSANWGVSGLRTAASDRLERLARRVGGRERATVIGLFASVLALSIADTATVGAAGGEIERSLHMSHAELGIVAGVGALVGAIATVPMGALADRVPRVRLLALGVFAWSLATAANGFATSFEMLLGTRVVLGVLAAIAGPVLASLIGDLFDPSERGRVYGWILSGEFAGAGIGFIAGGEIAAVLSWRWSFWLLALPGLALAVVLWRRLREPVRGGADRLPPRTEGTRERLGEAQEPSRAGAAAAEPPAAVSLVAATREVLSIRSNRQLILASALGYFFFTGAQTFTVVLLRQRFGIGQAAASGLLGVVGIGAVIGVLSGGRIADRLVSRGREDARVVVPALSYGAAVILLVPALLVTGLAVALPLFVLAVGSLSAANPPLDAARLDVVRPWLWGRAEGVRTLLRQLGTAFAPVAFGLLARVFDGPGGSGVARGPGSGDLHAAFLVMLLPLALSAGILWHARRSYPEDAAAAQAAG